MILAGSGAFFLPQPVRPQAEGRIVRRVIFMPGCTADGRGSLAHAEALPSLLDNDCENYDTTRPAVRRTLQRALNALTKASTRYPVYVYFTAGKDRTGVVIAAVLSVLQVPCNAIVEEYLLSDETRPRTFSVHSKAITLWRSIGITLLCPLQALKWHTWTDAWCTMTPQALRLGSANHAH